jgi:chorismate mutase
MVLKAGFDAVWIGARTTVNPFSVQELAEALKGVEIPVFIKNPIHPDIDLWIGAFERFSKMGVQNLRALHRGFSVSNKHPYRNKPMWEIPIAFRTRLPDVPLYNDPSHICGNTELLFSVAQRALDLGFDGLMLESHENPKEAWSDPKQQVTANEFKGIHKRLLKRSSEEIHQSELIEFRSQIDSIDQEIIDALARRMQVAEDLGKFKKQHGITIFQLKRWKEILQTRLQLGLELGLTEEFMIQLLEAIHKESIRKQNGQMNSKD